VTNLTLLNKQVRWREGLVGKTIKGIIDDDDPEVILLFTDGTFAIFDPYPEADATGMCLDACWLHDEKLVEKLTGLLSEPAERHEVLRSPGDE